MTNILPAALLNEMNFSYTSRQIRQRIAGDAGTRKALGITIPEIFPENEQDLIPQTNLGGNYAGLNKSRATLKQLFSYDLHDNLTRTAGRHILKTGFLYSFGGNRKTGFLSGFEALAAGSRPGDQPSFLERANAWWGGRQGRDDS